MGRANPEKPLAQHGFEIDAWTGFSLSDDEIPR